MGKKEKRYIMSYHQKGDEPKKAGREVLKKKQKSGIIPISRYKERGRQV